MSEKKLYRSRRDQVFAGVCAGIADYFSVDPTLVRLITFLLIFPGGMSIWVYIIAALVLPLKPANEI
ncbi:MAG: PspC domain-containing protein [Lachnospiraceae bacterium]|nr:PspC domain-containing protein [Lachnospiraceae bacterium]